MDNNINMNKSNETDSRSPLKELYIKNNTPEEKCENQNKETHLFDMETTLLENTVMSPAELNQTSEFHESFSSDQENLTPRYSVLNIFDPIRKEGEEVISKRHNNDLLSDNVLDYSVSGNVESLNADHPFPNTTPEDFVENTIEISVSEKENQSLCTSELNGTSASNISTNSDNSVLNNTVILNKSLIVENKTPRQITVDDNSNLSLASTDDTGLNKEQDNTEHILNETSSLVHLSNEQTVEETFERDQNKSDSNSLNLSSTLKSNTSIVINSNEEQNLNTPQETEVQDQYNSDHILNENSNDLLNVSSTLQLNSSALTNLNQEHLRPADETLETDHTYKINDNSGHRSVIEEQTVESASPLLNVNDSLINAFSTKLVLSPKVDKSAENSSFNENKIDKNVEESETHKQEIISNFEDKCESILQLPIISNEVILEESAKSLKIIDDFTEKPIDISLDTDSDNLNVTISSEQKVSAEVNTNISSGVNNSNLLVNETSNEIIKEENNKKCLENKIEPYEITNTSPQTTEIEQQKESSRKLSKEKSHSIELLSSTCGTNSVNIELKETASSELVPEGTHMSSIEPNLASEPTVDSKGSFETSATCTTNEMGEIINQNECFEKESVISSSAVDNNGECEKYKMQVNELKKELKSCRQKTCTLETEIVDFKRKENELNMLLEDYKQSAASTEELKHLQMSEEALKNEIKELRTQLNQQEIYLKDLQQKDTKEQNEQLKRLQVNEEVLKNEVKELKTLIKQHETQSQSDIQISRVMEEYEKSISSLISENEKMKKERDTAQMHLANIEMAFSDVHQKYERCKAIVQGYKDNEESFKQDIAMNRETIVIQEQKYETLKAHAMAQLEKSNQELAAMKKQHETEMARLTAQLKRYEIKNMSLMESLQQKAKECEQLSAVCDEFIGNV